MIIYSVGEAVGNKHFQIWRVWMENGYKAFDQAISLVEVQKKKYVQDYEF